MARDSQRSKFYLALDALSDGVDANPRISREQAEETVRTVLASRWWDNRSEIETLQIRWRETSYVHRAKEVDFPHYELIAGKKNVRELTPYMWLAQSLRRPDEAWHGREYCKHLLSLLKRFNPDLHNFLIMEFKANGVKYSIRAPRTLTPEQQKAATQRLREANVRKAEERHGEVRSRLQDLLKDMGQ